MLLWLTFLVFVPIVVAIAAICTDRQTKRWQNADAEKLRLSRCGLPGYTHDGYRILP